MRSWPLLPSASSPQERREHTPVVPKPEPRWGLLGPLLRPALGLLGLPAPPAGLGLRGRQGPGQLPRRLVQWLATSQN